MKYLKAKELVIYRKPDGWWIRIEFDNGTSWTPAIQHLGYLLTGIGQCEDLKYPHGEGRGRPKRFFAECFDVSLKDIDALCVRKDYNIPRKNPLPLRVEDENIT